MAEIRFSAEIQAQLDKLPKELLSSALAFNFAPAEYAHPTRLTEEENGPNEKLAKFLLHNPRSSKRLSRIFSKKFSLDSDYFFDFRNPLNQLALLPGEEIRRIASIAALAIHNKTARKFIHSDTIRAIANLTGQDGFEFAMQSHAYSAQSGAEVPTREQFIETIVADTNAIIHLWITQAPRALAARVALKFPQGMLGQTDAPADSIVSLTSAADKFVPKWLNQNN